jgi:hypothetical protein
MLTHFVDLGEHFFRRIRWERTFELVRGFPDSDFYRHFSGHRVRLDDSLGNAFRGDGLASIQLLGNGAWLLHSRVADADAYNPSRPAPSEPQEFKAARDQKFPALARHLVRTVSCQIAHENYPCRSYLPPPAGGQVSV